MIRINKILQEQQEKYIKDIIDNKLVFWNCPVSYDNNKIYSFPLTKYVLNHEKLIGIYKELPNIYLKTFDKGFIITNYFSFYFTALVDYFQEECRLKCRRINATEDFYEHFEKNRELIEKTIEKPITYQKILDQVYKLKYSMCSEFDPVWLINCFRVFEKIIGPIKNVLDMSAGRGARMLACASTNKNYWGIDPCECSHKNYPIMKKFVEYCGSTSRIVFIKSGFEENWEKECKLPQFDLMFSSPPYFNLEIYENTSAQSTQKFPNLENWLQEFLYVSMKKSLDLLRVGGLLALNIDNPVKGTMDYVGPMLKFKFHNAKFLGSIQLKFKQVYTVWYWQKID